MTQERSFTLAGTRKTLVLGALLTLSLCLWLSLATWSHAQAAAVEADTSALVVAESPELGQFLTDNNGRAIYIFLNDTSGVSMCSENCLQNWPPVLVPAADALPTLPEGMDAALLGTLQWPDGTFQLTYNGWPLYYFIGDTAAGMTTGQRQGEVWYLLSVQGTGVGLAADQLGGGAAP
ncbi:MAG: hypothetical protein WDA15_06860 [Trueperaceae bacterium]